MRRMFVAASLAAVIVMLAVVYAGLVSPLQAQESIFKFTQHDRDRAEPPVVTPATSSTPEQAGKPPSDAVVLFDGNDLTGWKAVEGGGPAKWKAENGVLEAVPGTGDIMTEKSFKSFQLHIEWASPNPPKGTDQDRGNSGIFMHGLYETQVLDSYQAKTYPDGQAGAIYGQYPPLVNACRPPGEWQQYDIIFHAPKFLPNGVLMTPAYETVIQNGVLVQDHVTLSGPTGNHVRPPYQAGVDSGPLRLQDHHHPVRYRNIWIRELKEGE